MERELGLMANYIYSSGGGGGLLRPPPDCPNPVLTLKICRPVLLDAVCNSPSSELAGSRGLEKGRFMGSPWICPMVPAVSAPSFGLRQLLRDPRQTCLPSHDTGQ